ncbi:helix-turn-helix transcriptional regulator [Streptomyces corynorhini]|uniref:Helix-turn-helix transcriptional regulator n=1 Tax=Streptomyces corynorhini TaxID=2282652 RepID=A0A370AZV4_9ACTN|nr:LuxR family transcriptional regulator [Streptomyces corynorhini]RDG34861.1 helix-turn-helix transcriptional regulator [Streptomyces corynorhini]
MSGEPVDEHAADATAGRDAFPVLREAEFDEFVDAVGAARHRGGPLTVSGAPGAGKTTLVESVARRFAADGGRVLRAVSSQSETDLPFSGLHQLLRPVRGRIDALPPRQRRALYTAFGLAEHSEAPEPMLIGIAVLTLLSDVAVDQPLLLVVDDAHWTDHASLDALSFVARRLADEPVTVVIVTRDGALPRLGSRGPAIHLGPLVPEAAERLLDLQPQAPTGRTRARILEHAEGNALALAELARAAAEHPRTPYPRTPYPRTPHPRTPYDTDGPLPVTDRLERIYAARLAALPPTTRRALVQLATADTKDPSRTVLSWLPDIGDPVWAPAEEAGLVSRTGGRLRCGNPLSRIAIYHAAPVEERRAAHLELAELFRGQDPDRYAWHLAAATSGLSTHVAAELENVANRARHRGGYAAAAHMLERAADFHPGRGDTTRLLAAATGTAVLTGRLDSVERLAARTRASTDDPTAAVLAALQVGRLMTLTTSHNTAFGQLTRPAAALADTHPAAVLEALAAAAVVRFYSADPAQAHEIERLLSAVSAAPSHRTGDREPFLTDWVRVVTRPESTEPQVALRLPALITAASEHPGTLMLLAIAAWLLDETDLAVRAFDAALTSWTVQGPLPDGLGGIAALAYLEHGRWTRAQTACAELSAVASEVGLDHAAACAGATDGLLRALRGDAAGARAQARHALSLVDPVESRSVFALAHRALGTAAATEGDNETAYLHYRQLFDGPGDPVHYHLSYPALPELASAAARGGHHEEAARIVDRAERSLESAGPLAPRRAALVQLSRALLAPPNGAESHFTQALETPVLARRPFEHAQTLLAYGEWLRRRRRIVEARTALAEAEGIFRRLGARPGTARAHTELRAAGSQSDTPEPDAFADLTPQQQQIVRLAARGLTNREVAEKMYLSPRTVSSHLYRAFPKLGITVRSQLRDVIEARTADSGLA